MVGGYSASDDNGNKGSSDRIPIFAIHADSRPLDRFVSTGPGVGQADLRGVFRKGNGDFRHARLKGQHGRNIEDGLITLQH